MCLNGGSWINHNFLPVGYIFTDKPDQISDENKFWRHDANYTWR